MTPELIVALTLVLLTQTLYQDAWNIDGHVQLAIAFVAVLLTIIIVALGSIITTILI